MIDLFICIDSTEINAVLSLMLFTMFTSDLIKLL